MARYSKARVLAVVLAGLSLRATAEPVNTQSGGRTLMQSSRLNILTFAMVVECESTCAQPVPGVSPPTRKLSRFASKVYGET